jgi:hypothetical protein
MISIARSRYTSVSQFVFLVLNAAGLVFGTIYNANTPDLYANNAHHKIGWIVTWIMSAQTVVGLVRAYTSPASQSSYTEIHYAPLQDAQTPIQYRWSRDSGQGTEPGSPRSSCPSPTECDQAYSNQQKLEETGEQEKHGLLGDNAVDRYLTRNLKSFSSNRFVRWAGYLYHVIDRVILILSFVTLTTGIVTYGGHFVSTHSLSKQQSLAKLTTRIERWRSFQRPCPFYQGGDFLLVWITLFGSSHG